MRDKYPLHRRTLSLDVRSNRIGYAVFEHERLLEAGITRFVNPSVATRRLMSLMWRFHPRVIVLRKIGTTSSRNCKGARTILRTAQRVAMRSNVRVTFVTEWQIQARFIEDNATTKYEVASLLVRLFPTLTWRLPPPRKSWESEHRNMAIFDAIALGVAYLNTKPTAVRANE